MGKATIKSGGAAGYYGVEIQHDDTRRLAIIARINATIAALESQKTIAEAVYDEKRSTWLDLKWRASPKPTFAELYTATAEMNEADRRVKTIEIKIASEELALAKYSKIPATENLEAWCADLTENLSGDVGMIEINGVTIQRLIQPGHAGNAVYRGTRDGITQKTATTVPEAAYWNLAMLPGWQKWKPTYRAGVISNIDIPAATCTVTLNPAIGKQAIDINQGVVLSGVPVRYMSCNARAFASGDRVIVEFSGQNFLNPTVIGFEDNPKPCGISIRLYRGDGIHVKGLYGEGTEAAGYLLYSIALYDADNQWVDSEATYNEDTGYWDIKLLPEGVLPDPRGYWIAYSGYRMSTGNYPYRFVFGSAASPFAVNVRQVDDLVQGGSFIDIVPYVRTTTNYQPPDETYGFYSVYNQSRTNYLNIFSSVPYVLRGSLQACLEYMGYSDLDHEATVSAVLSRTLPAYPTWWDADSATSFIAAGGVQLPLATATEIARILDPREDWTWDAFNAQFPSALISIGSGFAANSHSFTITPAPGYKARTNLVGLSSLGL